MNRTDTFNEIDRWLQKMDLTEWKIKRSKNCPRVLAQKIQFIATVIHKPELIILDETLLWS